MGLTYGLSGLLSGIGGAVTGLNRPGSVSSLLGRVVGLVSGLMRALLAILLLPFGIPLGAFALSLYGKAAQLLVPGSSRFEQVLAGGEGALRRGAEHIRRRMRLSR